MFFNLVGREWFSGISLDSNAGEIDVGVIHTLWNRFLAATTPSPTFNISLNLDTNKVRPPFFVRSKSSLCNLTLLYRFEASYSKQMPGWSGQL